jgi:competence protein ComEC
METVGERLSTSVDVMQVPHHGSMTGLSKKVLMSIRPKLAVISVGKNNYGHPAKYTLQLLKESAIPIKQTIIDGDVEIISNGEGFSLEK